MFVDRFLNLRSFILISALFVGASLLDAASSPRIAAEYPLPQNPNLGALVSGPDGNVWVAGYLQVSKVTKTGTVTTYSAQAEGTSIGVGPDGALWFGTYTSLGQLGRITTDGTVSYFPVPPPPGSSYYPTITGVVTGPDGNLWLSDYQNQEIIRYTLSGSITYFPIPGGGLPFQIVNGPDGALWAADRDDQVDRITTAGAITVIPLPGFYGSQSIALGADGNLWVNNNGTGLGRVTPAGEVTSFPITAIQNPGVQFVSAGPRGTIWFTVWAAYPHEYVGEFNIANGKYALVEAPGSGAYAITQGPADRSVWFTETFSSKVGVAVP